jgi:hypothetical protein
MMKSASLIVVVIIICGLGIGVLTYSPHVLRSSEEAHHFVGAVGGDNDYNRGQAPEDWWGEIKRMHGHVGPWNVLGWRIGQVALRELDTKWPGNRHRQHHWPARPAPGRSSLIGSHTNLHSP